MRTVVDIKMLKKISVLDDTWFLENITYSGTYTEFLYLCTYQQVCQKFSTPIQRHLPHVFQIAVLFRYFRYKMYVDNLYVTLDTYV